ncbi:MAG TPA: hypothetical protein VJC39_05080 [Candidatus Nanoarchaeia archaeon]|nr:hypothetical protein [Candidatus Nanoarchaeia archaeon]
MMLGEMGSIKITLETLYDILRNEKKREELQELESTFFIDLVSYLREKKSLLEEKENNSSIFAAGEKEKLEYELRSIRRILKEIYEKREKKIIDIALNRSRTGSDIIDSGAMLREEKEFYERVLKSLDLYRRGVLHQLFLAELPNVYGEKVSLNLQEGRIKMPSPVLGVLEKAEENTALDLNHKVKVRFTNPVPSFVWKDMKVYGPFDKGEETDIFQEVANLLVRKGRAEKV